jgi:CDGSH-type Zn-finger protein
MRITIRENGPYRVEGDVPLFDHLGNRIQPPKPGGYSLCRCGASSRKPFCDRTHSQIGFIGAMAAAEAADAQKKTDAG